MKKILILVLVSVFLAGCSSATNPTTAPAFTQIIAFGDNLSDTGHLDAAFREAVAQGIEDASVLKILDANYQGRLTNGPLAVEILADRLKVKLTSLAVGAGLSDRGNLNTGLVSLNNTGLLGQIDQFEKELNGAKADPQALYLINASLTDIFGWGRGESSDAINKYADQVLENIRLAITRLAKLGAKQFIFWNTSDMALQYPGFVSNNFVTEPKVFQARMDSQLPGLIADLEKELDVKIELFDYNTLDAQIRSNPEKYGLTNLTDACTKAAEGEVVICAKPDEYYYWDDYSLTRRVHQIIGEAIADQVNK